MALGIDIGGNKILAAKVKNGEIVKKILLPTAGSSVVMSVKKIIAEFDEKVIGIGVPGYIVGNMCIQAPHIKEFNNLDFSEIFPGAKIMNDATAMAYGEYVLRERKYRTLLMVSLGTGVGGGLVVNGKPYVGRGSALEIGHLKGFSNKRCSCGKIGCFETIVGGAYLPPMERIAKRAREGDKKAIKFYERYGRLVARGIAHGIQLLDPEIVVIGGGIGRAFDIFERSMKEELGRLLSFVDVNDMVFEKAKSYDSGALGAALIAKEGMDEKFY